MFATDSVPMISASTTISSTALEISSVFALDRIASLSSLIGITPGIARSSSPSAVATVTSGASLTAIVVASFGVRPASFWASGSEVIAPPSSNVIPLW